MHFALRSADTIYPRPISDSRLLAVLEYAFLNRWEYERKTGGDSESDLQGYLAPATVNATDARKLEEALARVEADDSWSELSPTAQEDVHTIRRAAATGEFQIEAVSEESTPTVADTAN